LLAAVVVAQTIRIERNNPPVRSRFHCMIGCARTALREVPLLEHRGKRAGNTEQIQFSLKKSLVGFQQDQFFLLQ